MERALNAELTEHLGYEKGAPRRRGRAATAGTVTAPRRF
jgi:transposase-like protein